MHVLSVKDDRDREFEGSPLTIQAFDDGLRRHLRDLSEPFEDHVRAAWFDRFLPMSIPFESYDDWKRRFPHAPAAREDGKAVRVILVGVDGAEAAAGRLMQSRNGWLAACVPSRDGVTFDWADIKAALAAETADHPIVVFAASDCVLHPRALDALVDALAAHPGAAAAFTDIEVGDASGRVQPLFFGAFDYERMLEQGYAAHCFAVRAEEIIVPRGERKGSLVRLFLALLDKGGPTQGARIVHVPGAFATVPIPGKAAQKALLAATVSHLAKRRMAAQVVESSGSLLPALRVRRKTGRALVSIVIPTRDRVDLLRACIGSIRARTKRVDYEIVIVDNDSVADATHRFLESCRRKGDRVVPVPGAFNYSHLNNRGVKAARGDFVCLLNNDTEIVDPEWLGELLSRLAEPDAGAAGPLLKWPNGMVQHGGIVLGPNFAASDAFNDCMATDGGYGDLLRVARECSAVSAACLLVRRKDYLALSGFDEAAFPVLFNDVDFCLRLRAAGKRIVFTPHVQLIHHEAATRGNDASPERAGRFKRELAALRRRWGAILADDPAYSPFLNLDPYPFSALAWPPRPAGARLNRFTVPLS
jgi:GT2 family glycosyltransferase